jgi:hypothetical protein
VAICAAAGHESNKNHHTQGKIEKTGDVNSIDIRVGAVSEAMVVSLWSSAYDRMSVSIRSPTGEIIQKVPIQSSGIIYRRKLVLERSTVTVQYYLGESNLAYIQILEPTLGIWTINVHGDIVLDGDYHAWLPITGFIEPNIEFLTPTPHHTIVTPATAVGPITCGAYNSLNGS